MTIAIRDHNVTDTMAPETTTKASARRKMRLERQARVGLLRNPNRPPKPPARRAALMGRWLNLRSSRRAPVPVAEPVAKAPPAKPAEPPSKRIADAVKRAEDGAVSGVDIKYLADAVRDVGSDKPVRAPYGSGFRADVPAEAKQQHSKPRFSALKAEAWADLDTPAPVQDVNFRAPQEDAAKTTGEQNRRVGFGRILRGTGIVFGGMIMAILTLLFLQVLGPVG